MPWEDNNKVKFRSIQAMHTASDSLFKTKLMQLKSNLRRQIAWSRVFFCFKNLKNEFTDPIYSHLIYIHVRFKDLWKEVQKGDRILNITMDIYIHEKTLLYTLYISGTFIKMHFFLLFKIPISKQYIINLRVY